VKKFIPLITVPIVMIMLACLIIPASALSGGHTGFAVGKTGGGSMAAHLDHLEAQGYDVSAIRAAVESGDMDTARSLLKQFMEEHKDEFPAPSQKGDGMTARLDQLEAQGYDVSAIRAAVESGDMDTARSLLKQFMEEHKDEFPAPSQKGDGMTARLDHLEAQGYDVSAIRAAVESGDMDTARSLLKQFMEEHKDEFPAPAGREKTGRGSTVAVPAQAS
jgi:tRNA A-37 threonylcarbamoyl transferase component Bud32